jgi:hypothetical protein
MSGVNYTADEVSRNENIPAPTNAETGRYKAPLWFGNHIQTAEELAKIEPKIMIIANTGDNDDHASTRKDQLSGNSTGQNRNGPRDSYFSIKQKTH